MTLSEYITSYLGTIYSYLGWSATEVSFIVSEVLEELDITSESDTDSKALHQVAKIRSLERALSDLSTDYTFSADGSSYQRSNVFNQVQALLEKAYAEYGQTITVAEFDITDDPYNPASYDAWWGLS